MTLQRFKELDLSPEQRAETLTQLIEPILDDLQRSEEQLALYLTSKYAYIQTLIRHIESFRGKRLRPALLHLTARAFGGEALLADKVSAIVEMIHLATLCHDDILDESLTRRQVETVNAKWGNKSAVMTGDILFSRAFEYLSVLEDHRPYRILSRAARLICEGELLQIASRFNPDIEEEHYLDLIEKKTAVLFGASAELGALLAGASDDEGRKLYEYGRRLGMAFQIVDDCLDLVGIESTVGKSLGSDLKNGEPTLPLIHLFRAASPVHKQELLTVFKPGNQELTRERLHSYFERYRSIEYALKAAEQELERAMAEIAFLPPSSAKTALQQMPHYVLERTR